MRRLCVIFFALSLASQAFAQGTNPLQEMGLQTTAPLPSGIDTAKPAAAPAADWTKYHNPYVGEQNNLANPNKTGDEISAWTQKAVADALSFTPGDMDEKISAAKKMFVEEGWAEYAAYVREAQLIERVRNQQMTMNTILNGDAVILGGDTVAGAYRWLVRAPVMITFLRKNAEGEEKPAGTGSFTLTLQIARVDHGGIDGVAIESWKVAAAQ